MNQSFNNDISSNTLIITTNHVNTFVIVITINNGKLYILMDTNQLFSSTSLVVALFMPDSLILLLETNIDMNIIR